MYLPFIRGKQFDLIAVREQALLMGESKKVVPIIEPVKWTSTLTKTITRLQKFNADFCLILNPTFGDYKDPENQSELWDNISGLDSQQNLIPSFIIHEQTRLSGLNRFIKEVLADREICFIHLAPPRDYEELPTFLEQHNDQVRFHLEGQDLPRIYQKRLEKISENVVLLSDNFEKQPNNGDYADYDTDGAEFFGEDHLTYQELGYLGFSDYLTIGKDFVDGGFTPKNVTFHLTFLNDRDDKLEIAHFVSGTLENPREVGDKAIEVLKKVARFVDEKDIKTSATDEIRDLAENDKYPGLGYLKKLSMSNHIEIIYQFLENHQ